MEFITPSPMLKRLLQTEKIPDFKKPTLNTEAKKGFTLEVFLDQTDEGGVMIQYDLLNEKGNTVWELGRTFNQKLFSN